MLHSPQILFKHKNQNCIEKEIKFHHKKKKDLVI